MKKCCSVPPQNSIKCLGVADSHRDGIEFLKFCLQGRGSSDVSNNKGTIGKIGGCSKTRGYHLFSALLTFSNVMFLSVFSSFTPVCIVLWDYHKGLNLIESDLASI